jgi:hypothetical protein
VVTQARQTRSTSGADERERAPAAPEVTRPIAPRESVSAPAKHEHTMRTYRGEEIVILAGHAGWTTWLWEAMDSVTVCEPCPAAKSVSGIKVLSFISRVEGAALKFATYLRDEAS